MKCPLQQFSPHNCWKYILLSNKTMNFLFDKLTYNFISKSNFFGIAKPCTGFTNCDVQL